MKLYEAWIQKNFLGNQLSVLTGLYGSPLTEADPGMLTGNGPGECADVVLGRTTGSAAQRMKHDDAEAAILYGT